MLGPCSHCGSESPAPAFECCDAAAPAPLKAKGVLGCCHATVGYRVAPLSQGKAFGPALWGTDARPRNGPTQGAQRPRGLHVAAAASLPGAG